MYKILISKKIFLLAKKVCGIIKKEWYAFPLGNYECTNDECKFFFFDLYVPWQYASHAHVDIPAEATGEVLEILESPEISRRGYNLLGMWHSHGDFAVFHSTEDLSNIKRIYETFIRYLPVQVMGSYPISFALADNIDVKPIIDNGFKGIKISAGDVSLEIDFKKAINNSHFFVKWYTYFAELKVLVKVLKEIYGSEPLVKGLVKNRAHMIASVVINNEGKLDGQIFVYETTYSGIKNYSRKARIEIIDGQTPFFFTESKLESIIRRIR